MLLHSLSLLEGLKKLQMQVFDQPGDTTGKCIKKTEDIETTEKGNFDEDFKGPE